MEHSEPIKIICTEQTKQEQIYQIDGCTVKVRYLPKHSDEHTMEQIRQALLAAGYKKGDEEHRMNGAS